MTTLKTNSSDPIDLTSAEAEMARASRQAIAGFADGDACVQLTMSRPTGEPVEAKVPARALRLLARVLVEMGKGNMVTVVSNHAELSTIRAAEIMRVSRPFLVKLLKEGRIPFRMVGAHRRVRYDDLRAYIDKEKKKRKEVLKELMAEQERLGLYE